jgi:hypothetical protein
MSTTWLKLSFTVSLAVTLTTSTAIGQVDSPPSIFEPPVPVKANGKVIDTGSAWGHSSPCVEDLDGDGLDDLIVGDFGGKFRFYRNVGTASEPTFDENGWIQAGSEDAEVNIYCCVGGQPRFCDLDGDGILDMIANSYDPGHCYLFRGLARNKFAAREELLDKSGVPVRSAPVQKQRHQSFGSFYETVDWDDDGDLDLLIGCFSGELKLRINEGNATTPKFASENIDIEAEGEPLKVEAHLCPVVADWDGDGLWDIVAGSDDGSVTFFRNIGTASAPAFAAGQTLVSAHEGTGYNIVNFDESEIVQGIRSQVEVTDYNGDGKLDLLVGDFYTAFDFRHDLSSDQKREIEELIAHSDSVIKTYSDRLDALREEFKERFPEDEIYSDEADEAWQEEYRALGESPEAKQMEENEREVASKLRPYLATTRGSGDRLFDLAKSHGHVWAYLRK